MLSGGERRRVELARILFAGSDVLLLDEPTNHLDTDAKAWLLEFLRDYRGALLVISHDLDLLDEAITRVLHLDRRDEEIARAHGRVQGHLLAVPRGPRRDEVRLAKLAAQQDAEIDRLQTLVDRFGAKATQGERWRTASRSASTAFDAGDVERADPRSHDAVKLPQPPHAGRVVLEVEGCRQVLRRAAGVRATSTFDVGRGERLLVMGLNGAGKTSLLRILAGVATRRSRRRPVRPRRVTSATTRRSTRAIHAGRTLLEHMRDHAPSPPTRAARPARHVRAHGDKVFQDAGTLSGGEKTKLALAQLVAGRHNLLLLDEPTNNLDPASREAVADALGAWPGTMVIVSHDREFVAAARADRVLLMPDGDARLLERRPARARRPRVAGGAAQCAARVREGPIVEWSEQEPAEAQRRTATRSQLDDTLTGSVIGPLMPITGFQGAGCPARSSATSPASARAPPRARPSRGGRRGSSGCRRRT